jgi:hypothetical protein
MEGYKSIFASKGVWGSIIAIGGVILGFLGFDVSVEDTATLTSLGDKAMMLIDEVMELFGIVLALYGRITATKKLT